MAGAAPAAGRPAVADLRQEAARYAAGCTASPDGWRRLLAAVAANLQLGFTGAVLVAAREPGPAATYDEWKAAGWQVRKHEHARVWILAGSGAAEHAAAVFTRAQVRPARPRTSPAVPGAAVLDTVTPGRAFGALTATARTLGYAVAVPGDAARPATDTAGRVIIIPAALDPDASVAALARELAAIIRAGDGPPPARMIAAAEAGSAAWLVLTRLSLHQAAAGITFPAAQPWAAAGDPRSPAAGQVIAAGERFTAAAAAIAGHAEKILAGLPPYLRPDPAPARPAPRPGGAAPREPRPPAPVPARAAAPPYGRYPRSPAPGRAPVTTGAGWPVPDQALARVNAAAAAWYRARLPGSWAEDYLHGRGFGKEICRAWQLGYAPPGWTGLLGHLRGAGFPYEVIQAAGLAVRSSIGTLIDVFRDRVIVPVRGPHGQIAGFAGRAADGASGTPKYINTPATAAYRKDQLLYGLPEAAAALAAGTCRPVLVEGYFDVVAVTVSGGGRLAGVGTGGTALSVAQVRLLAACCDLDRVPLLDARDADDAGRRAMLRDWRVLAAYCPAAAAPVLPEHSDPAAIFQQGGREALAAALTAGEHPLADVAVDAVLDGWDGQLQWPAGQLGAARAAAALLAEAPPANPSRQIARIAARTGLPHEDVTGIAVDAIISAPRPKAAAGADRPGAGADAEFPAAPATSVSPWRRPRGPVTPARPATRHGPGSRPGC